MKTERRPLSNQKTTPKLLQTGGPQIQAPKAQGYRAGNRRTTHLRIEKEALDCQRGNQASGYRRQASGFSTDRAGTGPNAHQTDPTNREGPELAVGRSISLKYYSFSAESAFPANSIQVLF